MDAITMRGLADVLGVSLDGDLGRNSPVSPATPNVLPYRPFCCSDAATIRGFSGDPLGQSGAGRKGPLTLRPIGRTSSGAAPSPSPAERIAA
jgi:hypothetical protein